MPRPPRRRAGTEEDQLDAGRRHLAAIDPAVMARVVGRPDQRPVSEDARVITVPAHRRPY